MKEIDRIPSFMVDETNKEKDTKAEIVMDFVLSWSLRCAKDKYAKANPVLNEYCRYMLLNLMGMQNESEVSIKDVRVWKEWKNIDVCVEVDLVVNGEESKHAILVENKYYSGLHDSTDVDGERRNQLLVYKSAFNNYYGDDWIKHYCLVACYGTKEEMEKVYGDVKSLYGFDAFPFDDMLDPAKYKDGGWTLTESDIFNEFWINW